MLGVCRGTSSSTQPARPSSRTPACASHRLCGTMAATPTTTAPPATMCRRCSSLPVWCVCTEKPSEPYSSLQCRDMPGPSKAALSVAGNGNYSSERCSQRHQSQVHNGATVSSCVSFHDERRFPCAGLYCWSSGGHHCRDFSVRPSDLLPCPHAQPQAHTGIAGFLQLPLCVPVLPHLSQGWQELSYV